MTDEVKVFTLMHRAPLDRLTRGRVALIGDAAHNMLPSKQHLFSVFATFRGRVELAGKFATD